MVAWFLSVGEEGVRKSSAFSVMNSYDFSLRMHFMLCLVSPFRP